MKALAWKYYIVFCCILACLLVIVYFLFPETRGYTLEEICEIFEGKLDVNTKDAEAGIVQVEQAEEIDEKHVAKQ